MSRQRDADWRGGGPGRGTGQDDPVRGGPAPAATAGPDPSRLPRLRPCRPWPACPHPAVPGRRGTNTLGQIRPVLRIRNGGQPTCAHLTGLIARRLAEVEARLAELARTRDQLAARAAAQDLAGRRAIARSSPAEAALHAAP